MLNLESFFDHISQLMLNVQKPLHRTWSSVLCVKLRRNHCVRLVWRHEITNFVSKNVFCLVQRVFSRPPRPIARMAPDDCFWILICIFREDVQSTVEKPYLHMIGRSSSSLADQQKYTSERIDEIMTMTQGVEYNNCIYYCTPRLFSGKLVKQSKLITQCVEILGPREWYNHAIHKLAKLWKSQSWEMKPTKVLKETLQGT